MKLSIKRSAFDMMLEYISGGHEELARIYAIKVVRHAR